MPLTFTEGRCRLAQGGVSFVELLRKSGKLWPAVVWSSI
jgi:hypothetical protein